MLLFNVDRAPGSASTASLAVILLLLLAPAGAIAQESSLPQIRPVASTLLALGPVAPVLTSTVRAPLTSDARFTSNAPYTQGAAFTPTAPSRVSARTTERRATVPVIIGAVAGAAIGTAVLFGPADCRTGESMCGVGIPLYVGGGALAGGLIGYLFSRR
jgi:hypothetical protein